MSPEIIEGRPYDKKTDIWSCGVIAYLLLVGQTPFAGKSEIEIQNNIRTCNYGFDSPVFIKVSDEAKDFIELCLEQKLDRRIDAEEALNHSWFNDLTKNKVKQLDSVRHKKVMQNLHGIKKPCNLLFELLVLFCQFLNDFEIRAIVEVF